MVIPAGTNPDAMVMEKTQRMRTFRKTGTTKKTKNMYPNRDIPTPEPVPGRAHIDIQTSPYKEILTDKPPENEQGIATEFYLDRPPVPLFQPLMPSKDCCKSTQIYEGDHELFDFNAEVEPMLNVLCSKTLEQARMEVLEETELEIIKSQQKEYDEIVNAELIMAQRYEAVEQRHQQEIMRRAVQDRARKEEKRQAHMKLNARHVSKNFIAGLREEALAELSGMGVLVAPKKRNMQEQVLPWLLNKIVDFLREDEAAVKGSSGIIDLGLGDATSTHAATVAAKYAAIKKAEEDKIEAAKQKEIFRQNRRLAREIRAKDQELEKFKDLVQKNIVFKGEVIDVLKNNITEIHGFL